MPLTKEQISKIVNSELEIKSPEELTNFVGDLRSEVSSGHVVLSLQKVEGNYVLRQVEGEADGQIVQDILTIPGKSPRAAREIIEGVLGDVSILGDNAREILDGVYQLPTERAAEPIEAPKPVRRVDPDNLPTVVSGNPSEETGPAAMKLNILDRLLLEMIKTGKLVTNPELQNQLLEVAKELMEGEYLTVSQENNRKKMVELGKLVNKFIQIAQQMGLEIPSMAEFLRKGLDRLKEENPTIPKDLDITEPKGLYLVMTSVLPKLLGSMLAVPTSAGETADAVERLTMTEVGAETDIRIAVLDNKLMALKEKLEHEHQLVLSGQKKELETIQIENESEVSELLIRKGPEVIRGEKMRQNIEAVQHLRFGKKLAAIVEGMFHIPAAPVKGTIDAFKLAVRENPVAAGTIFVGAITGLVTSDVRLAIVIGGGGIVLQAIADRVGLKFGKKDGKEVIESGPVETPNENPELTLPGEK